MGEGILIIASVIIASSVAAVVMNQVGVFESSFTRTTEGQKDTLLTDIKIVMATNTTDSHVAVWVKNVGHNPISSANKTDVYFGKINQVQRIPHNQSIQNDLTWKFEPTVPSPWEIMDTIPINITDNNLEKDVTYQVTVITPNGVSDEHIFSLPS